MTPLAEELDLLEKEIRRLQIEWDKFFGGVEKKPPNEQVRRVEAMIKKYAYGDIRNATDRFRYQSLTARYNILGEYWNKRLRAIEEGKPLGVHGLKADLLPPPPPPKATAEERPHAAAAPTSEVRIESPDGDSSAVRSLFDRFLEQRRHTGEGTAVKFESFQKLIAQQASRILGEKGARAVDFRVETKDGKVSLKAKPVK